MSNMSYCRFQNTASDLADCLYDGDPMSSADEMEAAKHLLSLCRQFVERFEGMGLDRYKPCQRRYCDAITTGAEYCDDCVEDMAAEAEEEAEGQEA